MADASSGPERGPVTFHYLKSNLFRVIHVEGVIGSPLPRGWLHMTVYSERPALPQTSIHQITDTGDLGPPEFTGKEGFVREMEADLVFSREQAVGMIEWLRQQVARLDENTGQDIQK